MTSRILPSLAFLAAIGIFFVSVNPLWTGDIATKKAAIAADEQALAAAQQYTEKQEQLTSARDAIDQTNLAALATFLPDSVDNVRLILDLNALAARSGLSVANVDILNTSSTANEGGRTSSNNPVGSVDLTLSTTGTFTAFETFLVGLEKSARLLDVHDMSITGSDTGVYTYKMAIRIYWLR